LVYEKVEPYYRKPIVYHVKKGNGFIPRTMRMDNVGFGIGTDYARTASATAELLFLSTSSVVPALASLPAQPAAGLEERTSREFQGALPRFFEDLEALAPSA
jgi:hypothetical protein